MINEYDAYRITDILHRNLVVSLAQDESDLIDCLALRNSIFRNNVEQVERVSSVALKNGLDLHCKHVIVRDESIGAVVATVRVVDDHDAHHTGRFFADTEFDLAPLRRLPGRCMEVRDFCVHPDYRRSPAAKLLWTGISRLLDLNNIEYVLTTCSVSISRGDHYLRGVLDFLQGHHAVSDELRVRPRIPYCTSDSEPVDIIRLPRRLRTYLSMGGKLCGLPYWDAMGNEARLLMMIQHTRAARAFLQRFTRVA